MIRINIFAIKFVFVFVIGDIGSADLAKAYSGSGANIPIMICAAKNVGVVKIIDIKAKAFKNDDFANWSPSHMAEVVSIDNWRGELPQRVSLPVRFSDEDASKAIGTEVVLFQGSLCDRPNTIHEGRFEMFGNACGFRMVRGLTRGAEKCDERVKRALKAAVIAQKDRFRTTQHPQNYAKLEPAALTPIWELVDSRDEYVREWALARVLFYCDLKADEFERLKPLIRDSSKLVRAAAVYLLISRRYADKDSLSFALSHLDETEEPLRTYVKAELAAKSLEDSLNQLDVKTKKSILANYDETDVYEPYKLNLRRVDDEFRISLTDPTISLQKLFEIEKIINRFITSQHKFLTTITVHIFLIEKGEIAFKVHGTPKLQ